MSVKTWWSSKNGKSKTITVLSTLLIVEVGLCFSTPVTVAPAYETLFGPTHDSELALGLEIYQFFLWLMTLAGLGIATAWHPATPPDEIDKEPDDR